jgi:acyl-coenzyme A thioesterase PaaI-like protein
MNILAIPFHAHLGFELASKPYLLKLKPGAEHRNHLGTVHASVMIALAEAGSGLFLQQQLGQAAAELGGQIVPVIRRIEAKFHQPGNDLVYCQCLLNPEELAGVLGDLQKRNRARVLIPMQVVDTKATLLLSASFDWFIQRQASPATL